MPWRRCIQGSFRKRLITPILALLLTPVITAHGQTVAIEGSLGEQGFGWMFRDSGVCYAIMPEHVAGPLPQITVSSGAPVAIGTGNVIRPFWEGIDLALAVVRGGITSRCVAELNDLASTRGSRSAARVSLHRLAGTGEDEWINLQVVDRGYLTIEAQVTSPGARIYQGTSGAFAFADDVPIGMATDSNGPDHVLLMRSEEILLNVGRFLSEQSMAFVEQPVPEPVVVVNGIPLALASTNARPISPRQGPDNVLGDGSYIFEPQPSVEMLFRVVGDAPVSLSRFILSSNPESGYSTPRRIVISTDQSLDGSRLRPWFRGDVGPDGHLDTGLRASRDVRWIHMLILSAWGSGPVEISGISAL